MVIDAHQHFWRYDEVKHGWIDESMQAIRKDFLPDDLKAVYEKNGVDGCVAIQADQTLSENDFLLGLAQSNKFIKGVVGWVDFRSHKLEGLLGQFAENPIMKGFRHVVQDEPDPNFLLLKDFCRGISAMDKYQFTYDILVFPHQLGAVLEFVGKFPDQKFVIDHIAKPNIKDGFFAGWACLIKEIALHENVHCKVSGLVTEADHSTWSFDQLKPYLDHIAECFTPKRLMFGSDWPVCLVAASYTQVKEIVGDFVKNWSEEEQKAFWGNNAAKFYNIN